MLVQFRLFLTLLVFVNVKVERLSAFEAEVEAKEADTGINISLPLAAGLDEAETRTPTDVATTILPLSAGEMSRARSIANNYDDDNAQKSVQNQLGERNHAYSKESARPLKNVFRGIYKSYKSTYMGNATSAEYRKRLIERLNAAASAFTHPTTTSKPTAASNLASSAENERLQERTSLIAITEPAPIPPPALETDALKVKLKEKLRKRKRKYHRSHSSVKRAKTNNYLNNTNIVADKALEHNNKSDNNIDSMNDAPLGSAHATLDQLNDKQYRYTIGPGVNMSFDMPNDIVNVNLDGDNLREIMRGRWLSDNSEEGRGKKYDMVTKVLPLFVLPFLIQSAVVPFLVTKLKLLLVKSILIGKLAIFLLILSAIKNNNKMVQSYEVAPSYWAGEPSRRTELAAAASSAAYNGYRVEGKPAAWVN